MVSGRFPSDRSGFAGVTESKSWCPGDSPLTEGGFLGYCEDRRWCSGDSPLTEEDFPGLLRAEDVVCGIPH